MIKINLAGIFLQSSIRQIFCGFQQTMQLGFTEKSSFEEENPWTITSICVSFSAFLLCILCILSALWEKIWVSLPACGHPTWQIIICTSTYYKVLTFPFPKLNKQSHEGALIVTQIYLRAFLEVPTPVCSQSVIKSTLSLPNLTSPLGWLCRSQWRAKKASCAASQSYTHIVPFSKLLPVIHIKLCFSPLSDCAFHSS